MKKSDDECMLKAIGRKNFSRYVKTLIKEDIERKKGLPLQQPIKQSGGIKFRLE
jgi:hypothetical protein